MTRKEVKTPKDPFSAAFSTIDTMLEIWGTNSTLDAKTVTLDVTAFDLNTDWTHQWKEDNVVLAPNSSTELHKGTLPGQPQRTKESEVPRTIVISARFIDEDGSVLSRYSNWRGLSRRFACEYADHCSSGLSPSSSSISLLWMSLD
jgi:beta-mannosidase